MIIRADGPAEVEEFCQRILEGLPLADAVLSLWAFVMEPGFLESLYQRHRGRSFSSTSSRPRSMGGSETYARELVSELAGRDLDVSTLVAPVGTVACNALDEILATAVTATPLKRTLLSSVKLLPLISTAAPTAPLAGEKLLTDGALCCTGLEPIDGVPEALLLLSVAGIT